MRFLFSFFILLGCNLISAQTEKKAPVYLAHRAGSAPSIDGILNDSCWLHAEKAGSFVQYLPETGMPAKFDSEVFLLYDDQALYIAAQLNDPEPGKIGTVLTPRDQRGGNATDHFIVGFDTYHDGQNGYRFEINAAGVQADARISPQQYDMNWDAVWQSRTHVNEKGWAVEIRIPYSAIRFPNTPVQEWGVQFTRNVQRAGELSSWSPTDPKIENIVQQWGTLKGLSDITPPLRLSFTPYIAGYAERIPSETDPVTYSMQYRANGGMDIKYGINESFTLDATLIPDFGQVQSDNTVLNLSQFEVRYEERRPFFTEGTELFGKGDIFYSRRIGGRPSGFYDLYAQLNSSEEIENNPAQTSLYNATKFSGRTKNGLGIGVLNAVAAPVYATVHNTVTDERRQVETGPLSNYNILVLDQNLPNNSSITLTNASTIRRGLSRDANVSSAQLQVRDKKNKFRLRSGGRYSYINDPSVAGGNYDGYTWNADITKISGKFQFEAGNLGFSKDWDPSDLGILNAYNVMNSRIAFSWLEYEPKMHIQNWTTSLKAEYINQVEPMAYQSVRISSTYDIAFVNFAYFGIYGQTVPAWFNDYYEPRVPGKKFWHAPYVYFLPYFGTDQRKPVQWFVQLEFSESPIKCDPLYGGATSLYIRINDHFNFTLFTESTKDNRNFGFAGYDPNTDIVTIGRRDIFVTNNEVSVEYNINSRMGINFRTRHYWSKVMYSKFYNLLDDGKLEEIAFIPGRDLNFNVFNVDLVYSWQFAPGSFLNIVWKNSIGQTDNLRGNDYFDNFGRTMAAPQKNSFIIKMIYYLNYDSIRQVMRRKTK